MKAPAGAAIKEMTLHTVLVEFTWRVTSACVPAGAEKVTWTVTRRRRRARLQLQTLVMMVPGAAVVSTQPPPVFISTCRMCGGQSGKLAQSQNMIPPAVPGCFWDSFNVLL